MMNTPELGRKHLEHFHQDTRITRYKFFKLRNGKVNYSTIGNSRSCFIMRVSAQGGLYTEELSGPDWFPYIGTCLKILIIEFNLPLFKNGDSIGFIALEVDNCVSSIKNRFRQKKAPLGFIFKNTHHRIGLSTIPLPVYP